jgi:hypothetical protein
MDTLKVKIIKPVRHFENVFKVGRVYEAIHDEGSAPGDAYLLSPPTSLSGEFYCLAWGTEVEVVTEHSDSEQELIGIEATLNSRGAEYGEYKERSSIEQRLKDIIRDMPTWDSMDDYQKSSLEMIVHKISRLCGNPDNEDTWHDIAGYASLVVNNLDKSASLV